LVKLCRRRLHPRIVRRLPASVEGIYIVGAHRTQFFEGLLSLHSYVSVIAKISSMKQSTRRDQWFEQYHIVPIKQPKAPRQPKRRPRLSPSRAVLGLPRQRNIITMSSMDCLIM
jgi:hypothetical protein